MHPDTAKNNTQTTPGNLPINVWDTICQYMPIPSLVNLGKALPTLVPCLDRAKDWSKIFNAEFNQQRSIDFEYFSLHWRKLYAMDTYDRLPEMDRTKLNKPVETLTECLLQDTEGSLFNATNCSDVNQLEKSRIKGGNGTAWVDDCLWYRNHSYQLKKIAVKFPIDCALAVDKQLYGYSKTIGLFEIVKIGNVCTVNDIDIMNKPIDTVTQLISVQGVLVYLTDLGNVHDLNGVLRHGPFTQICAWRDGFLALGANGTIYDSVHDFVAKYNDPIVEICVSLDVILALGASGFLYMLGNGQGLPIKDVVEVPGKVLAICSGFFKRTVYTIVSQDGPKLGKRSLKTKLKSRWVSAHKGMPQDWVGAGLFLQ